MIQGSLLDTLVQNLRIFGYTASITTYSSLIANPLMPKFRQFL